ncbi:MAG: SAM-dependent methyltransferase [Bacteriovoracaceae bacterium]
MTCNYGSEKALIHEVVKGCPELSLGFSKKGFVTFKARDVIALNFRVESVFARVQGLSLSRFKIVNESMSEVISFVSELIKQYPTSLVHVSPRERMDKDKIDSDLIQLSQKYQALFQDNMVNPETIIDLIMVEEDEIWVGMRKVMKEEHLIAGNRPEIELPVEAPSRAYLKIAEAFYLFRPSILPGETIMEIGSAPGGASYYLLSQGYKVIGVDNAQMDEKVFHHPNFKLIKKVAGSVEASDFSDKVKWLAMDINVKPEIAFIELKKILPHLPDLKGALLTLKMPKVDGYLEVPEYLKRLSKLGFKKLTPIQLFYNKQEVFIYAIKE